MISFSFNGIRKEYLLVRKIENRGPWAPIERKYQEVPGRAGAYPLKKKKILPRPLPIIVLLEADDAMDLQKVKEDFADWLIHEEAKPLIFDDEPDRTYYAVVDGSFDIDEFVRVGSGVIPFICPDPYKYGFEKTQTVTTAPVHNNGTVETSPVLSVTFTSPATDFTITHQESGKTVRVIYNFISGDRLEINMQTRKVLINGNLNMQAYYWKSKPFSLLPGVNRFSMSTGATATIRFRERWK